MLAGRSWDDWVSSYAKSHQHPINRLCHTLGIPMIVVSILSLLVLFVRPSLWPLPVGLFVFGWILQFVGHWFEGKPPEFFSDWRYLLVGLRWWVAKLRGRA